MEHFSLKKLSARSCGEGSSTGEVLDTGISLHKGPVGEPGGDSLARTLERRG